jgi:hypothetical protein
VLPREERLPDWWLPLFYLGIAHVAQALACLVLAAGLGLALAFSPPTAWKLAAVPVYGVLGLVGFLAQMVIGVNARLLPLGSRVDCIYDGDLGYCTCGLDHRWKCVF